MQFLSFIYLLSSLLLMQLIWDVSNNTRSGSNWSVLSHEGDDSLMEGLAYPPAATPLSSLPISLDDLIGEQVNYGTDFTHELCFLWNLTFKTR